MCTCEYLIIFEHLLLR